MSWIRKLLFQLAIGKATAPILWQQDVGDNDIADHPKLALAEFLLKILLPGTFARDHPDRNSLRKSKKASGFPARKPDESRAANAVRKIQFHLLEPWMIALRQGRWLPGDTP